MKICTCKWQPITHFQAAILMHPKTTRAVIRKTFLPRDATTVVTRLDTGTVWSVTHLPAFFYLLGGTYMESIR